MTIHREEAEAEELVIGGNCAFWWWYGITEGRRMMVAMGVVITAHGQPSAALRKLQTRPVSSCYLRLRHCELVSAPPKRLNRHAVPLR